MFTKAETVINVHTGQTVDVSNESELYLVCCVVLNMIERGKWNKRGAASSMSVAGQSGSWQGPPKIWTTEINDLAKKVYTSYKTALGGIYIEEVDYDT